MATESTFPGLKTKIQTQTKTTILYSSQEIVLQASVTPQTMNAFPVSDRTTPLLHLKGQSPVPHVPITVCAWTRHSTQQQATVVCKRNQKFSCAALTRLLVNKVIRKIDLQIVPRDMTV